MIIGRLGDLAYIDTFSGLIPCKVIKIYESEMFIASYIKLVVKVTATRKSYKRGEHINTSELHVIPRKAVHIKNHQYSIKPYQWIVDKDEIL